MFKLEKAKNGMFTLKYNNKYIHSKYNPQKEAEQFVNSNIQVLDNDDILLYGIGLGYHIEELAKKMKNKSKLYVYEYNKELINYCRKINSKIFSDSRIKIIEGDDLEFYKKLSKSIQTTENILIHKPSLETIQDSNEYLYNIINDYDRRMQFYYAEPNKIELYEKNFEENSRQDYVPIDIFIEEMKKSQKTYIIASAGPSLDDETDLLKKYEDDFNIIAVSSALRTLTNKGIVPNAVVIIDGKEIVKKHFEGMDVKNIPLCFDESSSRWAINDYSGPKYIFGNRIESNKIKIEVDSTVAVSAIDIAIKCNAKEIILLGQDLGYSGEKSHTGSYEETYGYKDMEKSIYKMKKVESVTGESIETSEGYLVFKRKIESLIDRNKNISFMNCSNGVNIVGSIYKKFSNYINQ